MITHRQQLNPEKNLQGYFKIRVNEGCGNIQIIIAAAFLKVWKTSVNLQQLMAFNQNSPQFPSWLPTHFWTDIKNCSSNIKNSDSKPAFLPLPSNGVQHSISIAVLKRPNTFSSSQERALKLEAIHPVLHIQSQESPLSISLLFKSTTDFLPVFRQHSSFPTGTRPCL